MHIKGVKLVYNDYYNNLKFKIYKDKPIVLLFLY